MLRRLTAAAAAATLLPFAAVALPTADASTTPKPPQEKAERFRATIEVTQHGIPHITASDFGSLGFGAGYAATEASVCTLADTLVTARGERSRWFGPDKRYNDQVTLQASNLQVDAL